MNTQNTSKHFLGGHVVVAAIVGQSKVLLIKETTKPLPHFWKLISETVEPGEPVLHTLWAGLKEEAGLDLAIKLEDGSVTIFDPRVKVVELLAPHRVEGRYPHTRHFYGVITTDEIVMSLSGQHLTGDEDEEIETRAFELGELERMVDLLPKHRELIKQLAEPAAV